jgi:hypothetical protein
MSEKGKASSHQDPAVISVIERDTVDSEVGHDHVARLPVPLASPSCPDRGVSGLTGLLAGPGG